MYNTELLTIIARRMGYYYGSSYWLWLLPALILTLVAQWRVKSVFNKYNEVMSQSGLTGASAARRILDLNGLHHVTIERVAGMLTDHFDPRSNTLRLSDSTYSSGSVAAIGVAAHEAGHAIQHDRDFAANKIRGALVPVANIGSSAGPYLAVIGMIMALKPLIYAGIILFAGAVLFYLVTLPVEFDASRRALNILEGIMPAEEKKGAGKVLRAAAMTYIASALTASLQLLRLVMMARRND